MVEDLGEGSRKQETHRQGVDHGAGHHCRTHTAKSAEELRDRGGQGWIRAARVGVGMGVEPGSLQEKR